MASKVLVPLLVLTNAAVIGGLVWLMTRSSAAEAPAGLHLENAKLPQTDTEPDGPDALVRLNFVMKIRDRDAERYVRATFDLELVKARDRDSVMERMPLIRDSVIAYFWDRTLDDLTGSAGIERSKHAIFERVQRIVPKPLRGLYLTDFVVL